MGCANAKPVPHTKRLPSKQDPVSQGPAKMKSTNENPEIRNQKLQPQKQNIKIPQQTKPQQKNPKVGLSDLQKNPNVTKEQFKQKVEPKNKQFKKSEDSIPKKGQNNATNQKPKPDQHETTPMMEINNQTPKEIKETQKKQQDEVIAKEEKNVAQLQTIQQRKQQSQTTKRIEKSISKTSDYKLPSKEEGFRQSINQSIPEMDEEEFVVSKISKPNVSAEKIPKTDKLIESPIQKESNSRKKFVSDEKINNIPIQETILETMPEKSKYKEEKVINLQPIQVEEGIKNDQSVKKTNKQIADQQIKITMTDKKIEQQINDEDFTALVEEKFDLGCTFDPSILVVDMNKVIW